MDHNFMPLNSYLKGAKSKSIFGTWFQDFATANLATFLPYVSLLFSLAN